MVLTGQKPTQRARNGECLEGLPGPKSVGCVERNVRNPSASLRTGLGDSGGSWGSKECGASAQGKRMVCHKRGNPETEVGQTLKVDGQTHTNDEPGRLPRRKGEGKPKVARESDPSIVL